MFVQVELTTREYDRAIQLPKGKEIIEHFMQQLVVELKADTIRLIEHSSLAQATISSNATDENEAPA